MATNTVTVTANKFDPNTQSFLPSTQSTVPTADQNLASFNQSMVKGGTITSDSLKTPNIVPLSTPKTPDYLGTINTTMADLTNQQTLAQSKLDAYNQEAKNQASSVSNLQSLLGGRGADTQRTYNEQGVTTAYNQIQDLAAQATGLQNEAAAIPIQIQNEFAGTGATDAGVAPIQSSRLRDNALKALSLGQQAAIANANYDKAKSYADLIVNTKYDQMEADIQAKLTNIKAIKEFDLSPAEKKLADITSKRLSYEQAQISEMKEKETAINELIVNAAAQNAPQTLLAKAQTEKDPAKAAMILGQYAGDFYKTELLKNQIATEKAQRAKYYSDIENSKKELAIKLGTSVPAASAKIEASQSAYNLANELKTLAGKGGAVGFGFKKSVLGSIPFVSPDAIAGTDRANYEAKFAQLKDTLASANLDKIKGAMSDKDIEFLRNIGTALNPNMSEEAFDTELEKIKEVMAKVPGVIPVAAPNPFQAALGQSTSAISGSTIIEVSPQGDFEFKLPTTTKSTTN